MAQVRQGSATTTHAVRAAKQRSQTSRGILPTSVRAIEYGELVTAIETNFQLPWLDIYHVSNGRFLRIVSVRPRPNDRRLSALNVHKSALSRPPLTWP